MIKQELPNNRVRYRPTDTMDYIFWWNTGGDRELPVLDKTHRCVWVTIGGGGFNLIGCI